MENPMPLEEWGIESELIPFSVKKNDYQKKVRPGYVAALRKLADRLEERDGFVGEGETEEGYKYALPTIVYVQALGFDAEGIFLKFECFMTRNGYIEKFLGDFTAEEEP